MTVRTHDDARLNIAPSARVSIVGAIFGGVTTLWRAAEDFYSRIQNRRGVEAMLDLEDSILRDMGVTRDDVRWASRLPLSYRAGEELACARDRRLRRSQG